jgi:hypothetical protein
MGDDRARALLVNRINELSVVYETATHSGNHEEAWKAQLLLAELQSLLADLEHVVEPPGEY